MSAMGVIGGSGLYHLEGLERVGEHDLETPFGAPSAPILEARHGGRTVFFLPRHGAGHRLLPDEVPYAANVYALKSLGVGKILSVSAVGSLKEELRPGNPVLPDQFIDRALGRRATFFGGGVVGHVSMADPTCPALGELAGEVATAVDPRTTRGGTYLCMRGPQFSSRAESRLYRQWGCDVIGMTNATEAKLAREAGICYASVCFVTDYDCWKTDEDPVSVERVIAILNANVAKGREVVDGVLKRLHGVAVCGCAGAAEHAVITAEEARDAEAMGHLRVILEPPA